MLLYAKRMFLVCDYCVATKLVPSEASFFISIGFTSTSNLAKVKAGVQGFRVEHYAAACKLYKIDANFFLMQSHTKMIYGAKIKPVDVELIELAARVRAQKSR